MRRKSPPASAWLAAGRLDSAVDSFTAALDARDAKAGGWLLLAQAELQRQVRRTDRDWSRLDAALKEAGRLLNADPSLRMLQVQVWQAKGDEAKGLAELALAIQAQPRSVLPFAVLYYNRIGQNDKAWDSLDQLKRLAPTDDVDFSFAGSGIMSPAKELR